MEGTVVETCRCDGGINEYSPLTNNISAVKKKHSFATPIYHLFVYIIYTFNEIACLHEPFLLASAANRVDASSFLCSTYNHEGRASSVPMHMHDKTTPGHWEVGEAADKAKGTQEYVEDGALCQDPGLLGLGLKLKP
jgi:hypothetical protein